MNDAARTLAGRWDLTSIFPALDSPAYEDFVRHFEADVAAFCEAPALPPNLAGRGEDLWVEQILRLEELELRQAQLLNYLACLRAENPSDAAVAAANLHVRSVLGRLRSARAQLLRALDSVDEADFAALIAVPRLTSVRHQLNLLRREAKLALSPREEKLVADLDADGCQRWARLAADTLAQTTFEMPAPSGGVENVAMSRRFELAWDPRPEVRRAAFEAVNRAFLPKADLMATCFNAMAGAGITLARWRGIDPIEEALLDNWIKPTTVETMQTALRAHAPVLHDYLRRKAELLGLESIGVFDRSAPLDVPELTAASIGEAAERIIAAFQAYCPALATHARSVVDAARIESEMRGGKQPGGFCASLPMTRETRIFVSFGGSFNGIAVIAHELGHSYHADINFPLRFWQQNAPSSLSETASILCEHILRRHVFLRNEAPRRARLGAIAAQLDSAVNYLLRIPRDFDFEVEFYRERAHGEVPSERLCELMRNAHRAWFGTALAGDGGDGLAWAYNHIMMEPRYRVYNFPYSFGYLLSSRIADAFEDEGEDFSARYDDFLHASATLPVEDAVSASLGFDVTTRAFWEDCLASVGKQITLFARLAD